MKVQVCTSKRTSSSCCPTTSWLEFGEGSQTSPQTGRELRDSRRGGCVSTSSLLLEGHFYLSIIRSIQDPPHCDLERLQHEIALWQPDKLFLHSSVSHGDLVQLGWAATFSRRAWGESKQHWGMLRNGAPEHNPKNSTPGLWYSIKTTCAILFVCTNLTFSFFMCIRI